MNYKIIYLIIYKKILKPVNITDLSIIDYKLVVSDKKNKSEESMRIPTQ